ncbi:MAG: Spy/CpxP family protein refolding chaperone [Pyrinomonadaceae bacterium]
MALRNKLFTTTTLAVALGAFGVLASAQTTETPKADGTKAEKLERRGGRGGEIGKRGGKRHGGDHRMGGMRGGMGMLRGIELTDAQKEQIKAVHEANKPTGENKVLMASIRETRKAGGTITEDQKAQIKLVRDAQKAKMRGVHEQILSILTPEQKAQLEAKKVEMKQHREEFREKRQEMREKRKADGEAKPAKVS